MVKMVTLRGREKVYRVEKGSKFLVKLLDDGFKHCQKFIYKENKNVEIFEQSEMGKAKYKLFN